MFTGIIRATTEVLEHTKKENLLQIVFKKPQDWDLQLGDSIATNGVCLTVANIGDTTYMTELMEETLKKSSFGLEVPTYVNLEQSMKIDQLLDGHLVQGHVDTTGIITERLDMSGSSLIRIRINNLEPTLVIPKGSITIDGMSLTIVDINKDIISVSLVDYTLKNTIATHWNIDQIVNIEYDMMGKYITNYLHHTQK